MGEGKLLPKVGIILDQLKVIEAKQEEARAKMLELRRSVFHSVAQELEEAHEPVHSIVRFELFWKHINVVMKAEKPSITDMVRFQELLELAGCNSAVQLSSWLMHWKFEGLLTNIMGPGRVNGDVRMDRRWSVVKPRTALEDGNEQIVQGGSPLVPESERTEESPGPGGPPRCDPS